MLLKITLTIMVIGILYLSLSPTETLTVGNDKISHFIAYGCLMLNIGLIQLPSIKKLRTGIIAALLLGCVVEVIQHFVPGRFMSFGDVIANTIGVGIGCLIALLFYKPIQTLLRRLKL
jgi:VanZ family protein